MSIQFICLDQEPDNTLDMTIVTTPKDSIEVPPRPEIISKFHYLLSKSESWKTIKTCPRMVMKRYDPADSNHAPVPSRHPHVHDPRHLPTYPRLQITQFADIPAMR